VSVQSKGLILQVVTEIECQIMGQGVRFNSGVGAFSSLLENYIISIVKYVPTPQRSLLLSYTGSMQSKEKHKLEATRLQKYQ